MGEIIDGIKNKTLPSHGMWMSCHHFQRILIPIERRFKYSVQKSSKVKTS